MTDTKQPEALRLAAWLKLNSAGIYRPAAEAAEILREQHARIAALEAENRALKGELEAIGAGGVQALRQNMQRTMHHGYEWVKLMTVDGAHVVHVSTSRFAYDEDGLPFIVAHADDEQGTPLRFYIDVHAMQEGGK